MLEKCLLIFVLVRALGPDAVRFIIKVCYTLTAGEGWVKNLPSNEYFNLLRMKKFVNYILIIFSSGTFFLSRVSGVRFELLNG